MRSGNSLDILILILFCLLAVLLPTPVVLRQFLGIDPLAALNIGWGRIAIGALFGLFSILVVLLNLYLAVLSPWLYRRRHGSLDDFSNISGLPLLAGLFIAVAGALAPSAPALGTCLLLLYVADPLGLPQFLLGYWRHGP